MAATISRFSSGTSLPRSLSNMDENVVILDERSKVQIETYLDLGPYDVHIDLSGDCDGVEITSRLNFPEFVGVEIEREVALRFSVQDKTAAVIGPGDRVAAVTRSYLRLWYKGPFADLPRIMKVVEFFFAIKACGIQVELSPQHLWRF